MQSFADDLEQLRDQALRLSIAASQQRQNSFQVPQEVETQLSFSLFEISRRSAPELDSIFSAVTDGFRLDRDRFRFFVDPEQNIQAHCLSLSRDKAVIKLSAGSINSLGSSELKFIIGHELSHFIFLDSVFEKASPRERRLCEMNADRFGLYACGKLDDALSALITAATGLTSRHYTINVGDFLQQAPTETTAFKETDHITHPPAVTRARALVRFGAQVHHTNIWDDIDEKAVGRVNDLVVLELNQSLDRSFDARVAAVQSDYSLWIEAKRRLGPDPSQEDWKIFQAQFGPELSQKMQNFYQQHSQTEVLDRINRVLAEIEFERERLGIK